MFPRSLVKSPGGSVKKVMSGKLKLTTEAMAQAALIVPGKGDSMAEKLDEKE